MSTESLRYPWQKHMHKHIYTGNCVVEVLETWIKPCSQKSLCFKWKPPFIRWPMPLFLHIIWNPLCGCVFVLLVSLKLFKLVLYVPLMAFDRVPRKWCVEVYMKSILVQMWQIVAHSLHPCNAVPVKIDTYTLSVQTTLTPNIPKQKKNKRMNERTTTTTTPC